MKINFDMTKSTLINFTFDELEALALDVDKVSDENRTYAMMMGLQDRCRDHAAISRKQTDGKVIVVTEQMRRDAVAEMVKHLESGSTEWSLRANPRAIVRNPVWLKLAEARGVDYDVIAAEKAKADLEELAALAAE